MLMEEVLKIAAGEVGYLEKKTNKSLDSKTANAGPGNYTKYARDLVRQVGTPYSNGVAWCDMFVDWCFIRAYGVENAREMLGGFSAWTPQSALYFKNMGRFGKVPHVGDVVFFTNGIRICHTGIVESVKGNTFTTIEGNTTTAQGEGVGRHFYSANNTAVAGFGSPLYSREIPKSISKNVSCTGKIVKKVTVHSWAGKKFPECSFSPLKTGDVVGVCGEVTSEYGVNWYYVKVGKKYGFIPKSAVMLDA